METEQMETAQTEKKSQKTEISEAMRKELLRLCTEGDGKAEGALTVDTLTKIERYVGAAKEMLIAEKISSGDVDALLRGRRRKIPVYDNGLIGGSINAYAIQGDDSYGDEPLAKSSVQENFGMTAVRELINGLKGAQESPIKLVEALAYARKHGMKDVVAEMERRLGVGQASESVVPEVSAASMNGGLT